MMVSALVLLAPGFEEIEATTVIDVLRRCNVKVAVAGLSPEPTAGAHDLLVTPDTSIDKVKAEDYDAVICPGGNPGYINLRKNAAVLSLVRQAFAAGKLVAAICAAPAVLADAGILKGKKCTIYPGMEKELERGGGKVQRDLVVEDGNVITSQGPATALHFALKVAERLAGKAAAEAVKEKTLANLILR
ncbi:MAG: DJ-1/PfpI family protein [Candidatus Bathyarchaeota archaeon]|nr:DJ-1/PfpI family protein [Candidatus Bathyarchaeota archaeon]